jgi:hypothetical protein
VCVCVFPGRAHIHSNFASIGQSIAEARGTADSTSVSSSLRAQLDALAPRRGTDNNAAAERWARVLPPFICVVLVYVYGHVRVSARACLSVSVRLLDA